MNIGVDSQQRALLCALFYFDFLMCYQRFRRGVNVWHVHVAALHTHSAATNSPLGERKSSGQKCPTTTTTIEHCEV